MRLEKQVWRDKAEFAECSLGLETTLAIYRCWARKQCAGRESGYGPAILSILSVEANRNYLTQLEIFWQLAEHALLWQVQAPVEVLQGLLGGGCSGIALLPQLVLLVVLAPLFQAPAASQPGGI